MLPSDPFILFSYVNTKLRDDYPSLDELCRSLDIDKNTLLKKLQDAGFSYDPATNSFR